MIKQIFSALFLGVILTLFLAQRDTSIHAHAQRLCANILQAGCSCTVSCSLKNINFFIPEITFENITVKDEKKEWQWFCREYRTGFSWLGLLSRGELNIWAEIKDLEGTSFINENNSLAVEPYLIQLLSQTSVTLPLVVSSLRFNKAHIQFIHPKYTIQTFASSESKLIGKEFKSNIYVRNSSLYCDNKTFLSDIAGIINCDIAIQDIKKFSLHVDGRANLIDPTLQNEACMCFVSGSWNQDHGRFSVRSNDGSLSIDPLIISEHHNRLSIQTSAQLPIHYISGLLPEVLAVPIEGTCSVRLQGMIDTPAHFDGHIGCEDAVCKGMHTAGSIAFHKRDALWYGNFDVRMPWAIGIKGSWQWDIHKEVGFFRAKNSHLVSIPIGGYWKVYPHDALLDFTITNKEMSSGYYECTVHNSINNQEKKLLGKILFPDNGIKIEGNLDNYVYALLGQKEYPYLNSCTIQDHNLIPIFNTNLTTLEADGPLFRTEIKIPWLRASAQHYLGYEIQGEGSLIVDSTLHNNALSIHIGMSNESSLRVPQTYNIMTDFSCDVSVDYTRRLVSIKDLLCKLHTGTLKITHARLWFDTHYNPYFYHIPLLFDHCLLNVKKDLFATISGSLLFAKNKNQDPSLSGSVIIDRCQLKENLFSQKLQHHLAQSTNAFWTSPHNLTLDVAVSSKDPIRIDTHLLKANAKVALSIKNTIQSPEVKGVVTLLSGSIHFPYKSLSISKGALYFVPDQPFDPIIELVAKSKIKKHMVGLQVTGSLKQPYILLEANPPLKDEHIVGLLLVGSEDPSLNMAMPALLVQNISTMLFSSVQPNSKLGDYMPSWFGPLHINVVPSFTDQTGRGGLRGSIEIDINDRWRAVIQKNFNLSEDTRFELEYFLSDDITLRAIRDERSDVSGEVEMRWKF